MYYFIAFLIGFITGVGVMAAGMVLVAIDPGARRELTKEGWKDHFRERR